MSQENSDQKPDQKGGDDKVNSVPPPHGNGISQSGVSLGSVAKLMGESGFCIWIVVDLLRDVGMPLWLKLLLWAAVALVLFDIAHTVIGKMWPKKRPVFSIYSIIVLCLLLTTLRFPPKPDSPHLKLVLNIGNSHESEVFLTNDFLFMHRIVTTSNLVGGFPVFNGFAIGCLVIPVQPEASNAVFNFTAENDSPVKFTDFQVSIAVPKHSAWSVGPKWQDIEQSLIIPKLSRLEITNLQCWVEHSPWPVFPYDTIGFSMTNASASPWSSPKNSGGFLLMDFRSAEFENLLAANIVFLPGSSNFSKPYVVQASFNPDGTITVPLPFPIGIPAPAN